MSNDTKELLVELCLTVPAVLAIGEFTGTDVILGLDPLESVLLVLTLILVRPISGRVSELDGLMLLTVGVVWVLAMVWANMDPVLKPAGPEADDQGDPRELVRYLYLFALFL